MASILLNQQLVLLLPIDAFFVPINRILLRRLEEDNLTSPAPKLVCGDPNFGSLATGSDDKKQWLIKDTDNLISKAPTQFVTNTTVSLW